MKKQFLIIIRPTKGRETIRQVKAHSAPEALGEWLSDMAEAYGISRVQEKYRGGFVKDSDPDMYIWQEGDISADFGDFVVSVEEIIEKGVITNPAFDNLFGSLGAMLAPLTITPPKEPEQEQYTISIQFTTNRKLTPQEADAILDACIIQVQEPYNNEGEAMDVTVIDYNAGIQ
jgi:hypothetical protein